MLKKQKGLFKQQRLHSGARFAEQPKSLHWFGTKQIHTSLK
jgi:hypothetical protein